MGVLCTGYIDVLGDAKLVDPINLLLFKIRFMLLDFQLSSRGKWMEEEESKKKENKIGEIRKEMRNTI